VRTLEEYEELAVRLALHPAQLAQLRAKVQGRRLESPLYDTARWTRNWDRALGLMHELYSAGARRQHIVVRDRTR